MALFEVKEPSTGQRRPDTRRQDRQRLWTHHLLFGAAVPEFKLVSEALKRFVCDLGHSWADWFHSRSTSVVTISTVIRWWLRPIDNRLEWIVCELSSSLSESHFWLFTNIQMQWITCLLSLRVRASPLVAVDRPLTAVDRLTITDSHHWDGHHWIAILSAPHHRPNGRQLPDTCLSDGH